MSEKEKLIILATVFLVVMGLIAVSVNAVHAKAIQDQAPPISSYHIKLYDGGSVVNEWYASEVDRNYGYVQFTDSSKNEEVSISGTIEIVKER